MAKTTKKAAKSTRTKTRRVRKVAPVVMAEPMMMSTPTSGRGKSALSNTLLFWLGIFFIAFAVLIVMAYFRQVEDAKQLIWFRQQQENGYKVAPSPEPTPTPKTRR